MGFTVKELLSILCVFLLILVGSLKQADASSEPSKVQLFQTLSEVGIDQILELPYDTTITSLLTKKIKVHHIQDMTDNNRPQSHTLYDEIRRSESQSPKPILLSDLNYREGEKLCEYQQAIQINEVLVCYKRAYLESSAINTKQSCSINRSHYTHCFIFTHLVTEVVQAIQELPQATP